MGKNLEIEEYLDKFVNFLVESARSSLASNLIKDSDEIALLSKAVSDIECYRYELLSILKEIGKYKPSVYEHGLFSLWSLLGGALIVGQRAFVNNMSMKEALAQQAVIAREGLKNSEKRIERDNAINGAIDKALAKSGSLDLSHPYKEAEVIFHDVNVTLKNIKQKTVSAKTIARRLSRRTDNT